jgi:hypothetical protein
MNIPADATTAEPFNGIEYWPEGQEIYFGARSRGEFLFKSSNGPVRWFEEPCTYSGFAPPEGARMRVGVTTWAECRYPIEEWPYYEDSPIFVQYPYMTLSDLILQGWTDLAPYEPGRADYSEPGVLDSPPVSGG